MTRYNVSNKGTSFYAIGLSYKKADADTRGHFSLNDEAKRTLLEQAKEFGIESILVTSTCNRTELYGFAQHPFQLIQHLCNNTKGTVEEFQKVAYVYKNSEVIPLSSYIIQAIKEKFNVKLKGVVVKNIEGNRAKQGKGAIWKYRALNSDYFIFKHEYILVFKKIK